MKSIYMALASLGLAAAGAALACPALADSDAIHPRLDYGGTLGRPPRLPTASELPDQIRLSKAIGDPVFSRGRREMLGEIADVWIDREIVAVVTLDRVKGAIPWSSLEFQGTPSPRFNIDLTIDDVRNAPAPSETVGLHEFKKDLLRATAVDEHGHELGKVNDVVAEFSSGTIDAVVIETGSPLTPKEDHAVAWSAVREIPVAGTPLVLTLSAEQLAQAPLMVTKAPAAAVGERGTTGNDASSGSSQDSGPLENSTKTFETPPPTRRH
jgi:hypothetical protein